MGDRKSPPNVLDLVGKVINGIKVISRNGSTPRFNTLWLCECHCGKEFTAIGTTLRRGEIVSCGCHKPSQIMNARRVLQEDMAVDGVQIPLLTKKVRSDSGTGHKGVYKRVRKGHTTYETNISVKGKRYFAGPFKTIDDAIDARRRLEIVHHDPYTKASP